MTGVPAVTVGVVLVAAGSGQRFGDSAKVLTTIAGKPMICHSLDVFVSIEQVDRIVLVAGAHSHDRIAEIAADYSFPAMTVVYGGETRQESVRNGLQAIPSDVDLVAVHDAARPLVDAELVSRLIATAAVAGAAVPVVPLSDTIYRVDDSGTLTGVEPRELLRAAQTPQVARRAWLQAALDTPEEFTDEGSALHMSGYPVQSVAGSPDNIKVTWPEDVRRVEAMLEGSPAS